MTEDTPIVFSLPDERDEGIFPLSLINYMTDKHNQFLEQLQQIVLSKKEKNINLLNNNIHENNDDLNKKEKLNNDIISSSSSSLDNSNDVFLFFKENHIPTHLLTNEHLISYSVEKELVPFLQIQSKQSLLYACGSDITYNWSRIENHIIDRVLSGKPFIDLELRKFTFSNETRMSGALSNLKNTIPQSELSPNDISKIIQELGSIYNIKKLKNTIEICIGFLSATNSSSTSSSSQLDNNILLLNYIRDTLLLDDGIDIFIDNSFGKIIKLKHIICLYNSLEENLIIDPFEAILSKYKQEIEDINIINQLKDASKLFSGINHSIICSSWKEMMLNYLNEAGGHININSSIFGSLLACEDLEDESWFEDNFPKDIPMKYCVESYKYFSSTTTN